MHRRAARLGTPLQFMVTAEAVSRTTRYSPKAQPVAFNPVGQVVGLLRERRSSRDVIVGLVEEYLDAVERFEAIQPDEWRAKGGDGSRNALRARVSPAGSRTTDVVYIMASSRSADRTASGSGGTPCRCA